MVDENINKVQRSFAFRATVRQFADMVCYEALDKMSWEMVESFAKAAPDTFSELGEDVCHAGSFHELAKVVLDKELLGVFNRICDTMLEQIAKETEEKGDE